MTISMDKQYRTRDGREVRIYVVDGGGPFPVHGAIYFNNWWSPCNWTTEGYYKISDSDHGSNLIEVKPRIQREVWMNVYAGNCYNAFHTRQEADEVAYERIACVKVTIDCEEGEGL